MSNYINFRRVKANANFNLCKIYKVFTNIFENGRFKQMITFTQLLGHSFGKNSSHYISQKTTFNDRQIQNILMAKYFTRTQKLHIGDKVFTIIL